MISAKRLEIEEFRGIRKLTLELGQKNFAVCGPNGTGKSGVVDALEFALTGTISRLTGTGTGNLSLTKHGPHVDSRNNAEKARVSLTVHIPSLKLDATITRNIKDAKTPVITPDKPDVRAIFAKVALHPEFALSRRELIKYVLAEPGKRHQEVLALLRLDEVDALRLLLQRIANACDRDEKLLRSQRDDAMAELSKALGVAKPTATAILAAANEKRALLGLPTIATLDANTSIKDGLISAASIVPKVVKQQAQADLAVLSGKLDALADKDFVTLCAKVSGQVDALEKDASFLKFASREALLKQALETFDGKTCPVCDTKWEPADFREHVVEKLRKYDAVVGKRKELEASLTPVVAKLRSSQAAGITASKLGPLLTPAVDVANLTAFSAELGVLADDLAKPSPLSVVKAALEGATKVPAEVKSAVIALSDGVAALPEPNQQDAARDFLSAGQERLDAYRKAALKLKAAEAKSVTARFVSDFYTDTTTASLNAIYKSVEAKFVELYRFINEEDEAKFEAKLTPSSGKLGFDVDFYGRGLFPPGSYHSEGHQDGMGLCLYLALMSHLAGGAFTLAVLDDVLMSVDVVHRRAVSKLLKEKFKDTRFVITTHDEIWLRHMKTAGLIEGKGFIYFRTWNVDKGPAEMSSKDVWQEIDALLSKNDIKPAAHLLRDYLEYFSFEACHAWRVPVEFHGDARYTLGHLLPNALSALGGYLKAGKAAAQSWGQAETMAKITEREGKYAQAFAKSQVEQWQVNPNLHYNQWANFQKQDFKPVVDAFRELLTTCVCDGCNAIFYVLPDHGNVEQLRCSCMTVNVNLKKKKA